MKFEPVEGNGWYISGRRIPPPSAFFVVGIEEDSQGNIEGLVHDRGSEFDGYHLRARPTFLEDKTWLSIHMRPTKLATSDESALEVFGHVRIAT